MLGNFFWRSTDRKKRVNKKRKVEIDSPASSGGEENLLLASAWGSTVNS